MDNLKSPPRILVFGGHGLLGSSLIPELQKMQIQIISPLHREIDITEWEALCKYVNDAQPDILINLAALSNVDQCEQKIELAFTVNCVGAHNIALCAAERDIPLLHVSTDYVFDGKLGRPYCEHDFTGVPPNQYGRSKLEAEQLIRETCRKYFIVRVAALYGHGSRPGFIDWVLQSANSSAPLRIVSDRFVSPTWTFELSQQICLLMQTPFYGTYHAAGQGSASWYEFAKHALMLSGKDPEGIVPILDKDLKSGAIRAPFTALENHMLKLRGLNKMSHWSDALASFIKK